MTMIIIIIIITTLYFIRQVHNLLQSECFKECHLEIPFFQLPTVSLEIFVRYVVYIGSYLPTFRGNICVRSSRVKQSKKNT
jgi:uncharacterized protein with PQ loop repeat